VSSTLLARSRFTTFDNFLWAAGALSIADFAGRDAHERYLYRYPPRRELEISRKQARSGALRSSGEKHSGRDVKLRTIAAGAISGARGAADSRHLVPRVLPLPLPPPARISSPGSLVPAFRHAHCPFLPLVSLLSAFSCPACCGYKRGVDYKIMKIYGTPSGASR